MRVSQGRVDENASKAGYQVALRTQTRPHYDVHPFREPFGTANLQPGVSGIGSVCKAGQMFTRGTHCTTPRFVFCFTAARRLILTFFFLSVCSCLAASSGTYTSSSSCCCILGVIREALPSWFHRFKLRIIFFSSIQSACTRTLSEWRVLVLGIFEFQDLRL